MMVGNVGIECEGGEIRNVFPEVALSSRLQVVVPGLAVVDGDSIVPMYNFTAERHEQRTRMVRVLAHCVGEECEQFLLVDRPDHQATEFFRPQAGKILSSNELPSVLAHTFSLIGLIMGDAPRLSKEVEDWPGVGLITRR